MNEIRLRSYAKINLTLDVLGKRDDGYHDVKMVMQTVSLYDRLTIKKADKISLDTNLGFLPTDRDNLAYSAAAAFFERTGINGGCAIRLEKHIPVGAGLAGGSGNAAAVLISLNRLYGTRLKKRELCEIGESLGADVPFCIMGGTRLAEGIGERLSPLPPMPRCEILLVKPPFSISTAWAYKNIDSSKNLVHPDTDGLIEALRRGDLDALAKKLGNVLEDVSIGSYPVLSDIKSELSRMGALGVLMSGSGPTVFGIFNDEQKALDAKEVMREKYKAAYVCCPIFPRRQSNF